ncbi:FAD-binding oxidoreductase [Legionella saoudiensis]|uniref:FAD-binding oxidoreductase n=1 Tax=Legionella saoudiensis TaxID=1750561 RepID=UPI00072FBD1C|nr:FAD-binding oxidoreductase [Legionella saoudiensis]
MHSKKTLLSNFSHAMFSQSLCLRPENEQELIEYNAQHSGQSMLPRGAGLSYNDSCFNTDGFIVDTQRFNHLISFDVKTGIVICQGGLPIKDLFLVHPEFIPPVIPGTIHATVAGSIAHDVHGKNNPHAGSFGHHIVWLDLLLGAKRIHCSPEENQELFYATIAGLGLTGIIMRAAIRLQKKTRQLQIKRERFTSLSALTEAMINYSREHDYQVAWMDLLHTTPRSVLSVADHCPSPLASNKSRTFTVPKLPFNCITQWNMQLFNSLFFKKQKTEEELELLQFNNPLDKLNHWNRLYGSKGLMQFQAVFSQERAAEILEQLIQLIRNYKATPTLAVLKLFTQSGYGLLSFCQPGFTLAVDFIHNDCAIKAVNAMNQLITECDGRVYLAKDQLLNSEQFQTMYEKQNEFSSVLKHYGCYARSDLARRLGIIK